MFIQIQHFLWSHFFTVMGFIFLNIPYLSFMTMNVLLGCILLALLLEICLLFSRSLQNVFWQRQVEKPLWVAALLSLIVLVNAWGRWNFYNDSIHQTISIPYGAYDAFQNFMTQALLLLVISCVLLSISVSALFLVRSTLAPMWWLAQRRNKEAITPHQK
jgi:nucleoside permease NupC